MIIAVIIYIYVFLKITKSFRDKHMANTGIHNDWNSNPEQQEWVADALHPQPSRLPL